MSEREREKERKKERRELRSVSDEERTYDDGGDGLCFWERERKEDRER